MTNTNLPSIHEAYFIGYRQAYILSSSIRTGVHLPLLVIVSELEGSCVLALVYRNFAETNITLLDLWAHCTDALTIRSSSGVPPL